MSDVLSVLSIKTRVVFNPDLKDHRKMVRDALQADGTFKWNGGCPFLAEGNATVPATIQRKLMAYAVRK